MTQSYTMEDVEDSVFQLLVQWLYQQKFEYDVTQAEADSLRQYSTNTEKFEKLLFSKITKRQESLIKLWVLADRLAMPTLQNTVLGALDGIRWA
jgi:hypothetical protein